MRIGRLFLVFLAALPLTAEDAHVCLMEKSDFLSGMILLEINEYKAFSLPPDADHDVILAAPTSQIGSWLELRYAQGVLQQVRRVSALLTTIFSFDDQCQVTTEEITRVYEKGQDDFDDKDLQDAIVKDSRGVIYTISSSHPLSELALPAITECAKKHNLPLTLLTDSSIAPKEFMKLKEKYPTLQKMASIELIYRGMFNHFPSTLLYKDGQILGRPLLGARGFDELDQAFTLLLETPAETTSFDELNTIFKSPRYGVMDGIDTSYTVKRTFSFPADMYVKFARSIPDSDLVLLFEARGKRMVHVYDSVKEEVIKSYKNMTSPYMSPDGRFAVFMDEEHHLVFQLLSEDEPFFRDTMDAWYPGISVIKQENGVVTYRLITRMMDLKVQDYQIDFMKNPPTVTRLNNEHRICTNFPANATPYMSRFDGDRFTLIQADNTRQIVKLHEDNTCEVEADLGFWTWKATFSFDDQKISFTAVHVNSMVSGRINTFKELFVGHAFLYDRLHKRLSYLNDGIIDSFSYPEYRSDGTIMVLKNNQGFIFSR